MTIKKPLASSLPVLLLAAALLVAAISPPVRAQSNAWNDYIDQYIETFFAAHPAFAVQKGRHDYDGQLPDWSAQGIAAEIERLKQQRAKAQEFADDELSKTQRFQRDYVLAAIDRQLFWLDDAQWPFRSPAFYFDWLSDSIGPNAYVAMDYAPLEQRMRAYIKWAGNIPRAVSQIRANLRMPMARTVLQYGVDSFGGFASYVRNDVPEAFAEINDEALQAEFKAANDKAAAAFDALTAHLRANLDSATEDYALGPELFQKMLYAAERVDTPLAQLEEIGRADMRRNQAALKEACAEFTPGKSIRECFAKMAGRKPEGGSVAAAKRQLGELKAHVIEQELVSIPGEEEARVQESPPYARSNFAFINIPGPYEKGLSPIYNISPPNPAWPEDVQRDYIAGESDLLFTSAHEVWPGHFLNFLHANRAEFTFGRVFVSYAFSEGWAHYTEELMLETGLRDASPETRVGQLSNALMRNARFLSAIGLHTGGMTVEESERLFIEEAYQGKGTAQQQANRGTYDPAYLNYTLGKLMIRQLRDDWAQDRGGRKAWREFHDTFLSFGGPAIPLVRGAMLDQPAQAVFYREPPAAR